MTLLFLFVLLFSPAIYYLFLISKYWREKNRTQLVIGFLYPISIIIFILMPIQGHDLNYDNHTFIGMDSCYMPYSGDYSFTLFFYALFSSIALKNLYFNRERLAPLLKSIYLAVTLIGMVISFFLIIQIINHDIDELNKMHHNNFYHSNDYLMYLLAPFIYVIYSLYILVFCIKETQELISEKVYSNSFFNKVNDYFRKKHPVYFVILLLPIFVLVTILLLLFGQEIDSVTKLYTETSTYYFSRHQPLEPIKYSGHYLCTVAAHGSPKIVKPIRIGKRHNRIIIVNRQLMVANAFEEIIHTKFPVIHRVVRKNYDKYGLDLSKKINNHFYSNLTYILMKPFEYFFLMVIYAFEKHPERLINNQYRV